MTTQLIQQKHFDLIPNSLAEAKEIATILSNSDLTPKDYKGNPKNVFFAVQWGLSLGLHPIQALQNISVINGRPALWGDTMLAVVMKHKDCEFIHETIDVINNVLTATCTVKRRGHPVYTVKFSERDAQKAKLWGKAGPWTLYPKRMLQMRARGHALRDKFPDALNGIGITEEVIDIPQKDATNVTNPTEYYNDFHEHHHGREPMQCDDNMNEEYDIEESTETCEEQLTDEGLYSSTHSDKLASELEKRFG